MNRSSIKGLLALAVGLPALFIVLAKVLPDQDEKEGDRRPDIVEILFEVIDVQTGKPVEKALVQSGHIARERFRTEHEAEAGVRPAIVKVRRVLLREDHGRLRVSAEGYRPKELELKVLLKDWQPGMLPVRVTLLPE